MPIREHEIPLRLVQNQPALAPALLETLGFEVPHHTEALNTSSVLTNCDPKEFNSDGAVLLRNGSDNVMAVVVERQNGRDYDKRRSWPAYLVTLHVRLKCPAMLLVLCPTDAMAHWCAEPLRTGPDIRDSTWCRWQSGRARYRRSLTSNRPRISRNWPCCPPGHTATATPKR